MSNHHNPNYQNQTSSQDCWHCSLVSYQVSYLTAETMHHLSGYILPGLIFTILGLRWSIQLIWEWNRQMVRAILETAGLPPTPSSKGVTSNKRVENCCFFSLPWEGIVKLLLTGLGIVVSVLASTASNANPGSSSDPDSYVSNVRYATVYLFFALSGLTDILVYYCGYSVLPEGVQSFILTLAFSVEGLMFTMRLRFEGYLEQQIHALLVVAIFCCAFACAMEVLYDNRLVKFCRAYLCLIQGTWLIHGGFIMQGTGRGEAQTYPDSLEWVSILFTWHVAANFVLFILALLIISQISRKRALSGAGDDCAGCIQVVSPPPTLSQTTTALPPRPTTTTTQRSHAPLSASSLNPSSPSPHSSSSSYQQQHSSPTTVQTNISPATVYNHNHDNKNSTSYIQKQQLPPPPNASINTVGLTVVPTPAHSLKYQPYNLQEHVNNQQHLRQQEDNSRASSAALQNLISGSNVDNDVESVEPAPPPPVIVDSMPRDRVVISEEYRTLTREDELRQSIKLKESSLI